VLQASDAVEVAARGLREEINSFLQTVSEKENEQLAGERTVLGA
jgi:hypothetical protein